MKVVLSKLHILKDYSGLYSSVNSQEMFESSIRDVAHSEAVLVIKDLVQRQVSNPNIDDMVTASPDRLAYNQIWMLLDPREAE